MTWQAGMHVADLQPNIHSPDRFRDSLWDWCFLNGCFGQTKIKVSDVDGIVERNGQILFIEGKPPGFQPMEGQMRLWRGLAGRGIYVLVLWGEAEDPFRPTLKTPGHVMVWKPGNPQPFPKQATSVAPVRRWVERWFDWADKGPSGV
jgi:hypothetical protein